MADFFKYKDLCSYPTVCGKYGICSDGQCDCLGPINGISYFQRIEGRQPDCGCFPVTPLSCEASKTHILLELQNITYIPFKDDVTPRISVLNLDYQRISSGNCKQACLKLKLFVQSCYIFFSWVLRFTI